MRMMLTLMLITLATATTGKELFGLQLFSSSKDLNTVGDEFMVEYVVHGYNQNGRKRNLYEVEVNVPFPNYYLDYYFASYDKTTNKIESIQGWKDELKSLSNCIAMAENIARDLSRNLGVTYSRETIRNDIYFHVISDLRNEGYSLHVVCLDKFSNDLPSLAVEMYSKKFKLGFELDVLMEKLSSFFE